ncbi:MAG: hypothetical protein FWD53_10690 [Phycisphaerales bacterium]|nr:hypothetical protein [Phycisphaerales bacterium]
MEFFAGVVAFFVSASAVFAQVTPMDLEIPELKPTKITCIVPEGVKGRDPDSPEYHYVVILPAGYHSTKQEYPVLWVASPGGNVTPGIHKEVLAREQMIGIGLTESRNGPWKDIQENYLAAINDATKRFRIATGFAIATGFSGAARASSYFASRPTFGGVLLQGGGLSTPGGPANFSTLNQTCCVYGVFGIGDGNAREATGLANGLPATCVRRFSLQSGNHAGAQKLSFDEGMNFLLDAIYTQRPPAGKEAVPQYVIRFRLLHERAKGASGLEKYETLEYANRIAAARKFTTEKLFADEKELPAEVAEVTEQLKELAKDAGVVVELEARAAFRKVRDVEDSKWPSNTRDLTTFAKQCVPQYEAVAKKFPDTVYGKRAADRAEWLTLGVVKGGGGGGKDKGTGKDK